MSSIAAAGVLLSTIIPGGMIAPPTSWALSRRLTNAAGSVIPPTSMINVNAVTAASCAPVMSDRIAPPPPDFEPAIP